MVNSLERHPRKVAIMGGTFNPVHNGHLIMADQALHQFQLDEVLWIPTGEPPHKSLAPGATSQDRLEMLKLAIADHPRFNWSDVELQRTGRSYSIDTLEGLIQQQPLTQWYWILGIDALKDLPKWQRAQQIIRLCCWIVAPRVSEFTTEAIIKQVQQALPINYVILQAPYIELSSTFLRDQIQSQGSIRYLVPPLVADYIQQHRLYGFPG